MGGSQTLDVNRLLVEVGRQPYQQEVAGQPHPAFPLPNQNSLERFFQHAAQTYVYGGEHIATGLADIWSGRLVKGIPAVGIGILSMRLPGETAVASKGVLLGEAHAACLVKLRNAIEQGKLIFDSAYQQAELLRRLGGAPSVALFDHAINVIERCTAGGKLAKKLIAELIRLRALQREVESQSQVTKAAGAAAEVKRAPTPATAESGVASTIQQPGLAPSGEVLPSSLTVRQIRDLFDVSKSTLFRWEQEGVISQPARDWRNWRVYTQTNVKEIATAIQKGVGSAQQIAKPVSAKSVNAVKGATQFTTDQVCELLDISKATLLRWERDGVIAHIARDWRSWRVYTQKDVDKIKKIIRTRNGQRAD